MGTEILESESEMVNMGIRMGILNGKGLATMITAGKLKIKKHNIPGQACKPKSECAHNHACLYRNCPDEI